MNSLVVFACLMIVAINAQSYGNSGYGPSYGVDNSRNDLRAFLIQNRLAPWSFVQRSIWGTRVFFKRSADYNGDYNNNNYNYGVDNSGNDLRSFLIQNRLAPWSFVQRSIWGTRVFFKRSADYGGDYYGGDNGRNDLRAFLIQNRLAPWSFVQRSIWGTRVFFKRSTDQQAMKPPQESQEGVCIYNSTSSIIKCSGVSPVECPVEAVVDTIRITTFNAFAISATPIGDSKKPETVKYSLYPRKMDRSGWKHSKIRDSAKQVHEYSLFSSSAFSDKGLRVRDDSCWKKLISYFGNIKSTETITLGTKPGRIDDVKILAKVFIDRLN